MSWKTILVLVLVVAGLGYLAWRTSGDEDRALAEQEIALFPGLDANLVTRLRIENVGRDLHMSFERDGKGGWRLTDPVDARAEPVPLDLVVEGAVRARGPAVAADEAREPAKLGLEPPRFVLDVETGAGGKRQRAEFGAADLDGQRMFARAEGRIVRVTRELEPLLDMQLHELRASTITDLDARTVVELSRTGSAPTSGVGPAPDIGFAALSEGGVWRATKPVIGALDPGAIALYVQTAVAYRYETVVDEGARTLASLGLDPPELTLRFATYGTDVAEILLGRTGAQREGGWVGTRAGSSVVWAIPASDVGFFTLPLEDLLDHKLVRARRGAIERLEIGSSAGEVRLVRDARGWTCQSARAGSTVFGPVERAETRVVEDVLGELERYELAGFVRGARFDAGPSPLRWKIAGEGAETGGTFGAAWTDAAGASDVLFQRDGETAVAHGAPGIVARLTRDPEHFLSLELAATAEVDLAALVVRDATRERRYERNAKGVWVRPGGEVEARELRTVLESLLFVRASERVPEAAREPLAERIEVELVAQTSAHRLVVVGTTVADGGARRVEAEVDGRRGVLADARLHEKLTALLAEP